MIDSDLLDKGKKYDELPKVFIFYISLNDFLHLEEPISMVQSTIGSKNIRYDDGKYIFYVNASVNDGSEVSELMKYFKTADPNDAGHGALSKRVHLLKCEPEGEEPMCAITESFVEEGEILGVIRYMRKHGATESEILDEIKEEFSLDDFEAESFLHDPEPAFG